MSVTNTYPPSQPAGATGNESTLWMLRAAKAVVLFVYAFVLLNLVMLILGFFLRLFGASTDAAFTRWVYRSVDRIMEPFRGMFPSHSVSDTSVLDVSLLFAMIVYMIVGIALQALVAWLTDKIVAQRRRQEIASERATQLAGPAYPQAGQPGVPGQPSPQPPSGMPASSGPTGSRLA